jgi:hypothetical protein
MQTDNLPFATHLTKPRTPPPQVGLVRPPPAFPPPPLRIGAIYQEFTSPEVGEVRNIIEVEAALPLPLLSGGRLAFTVEAGYEVRTARR